MKMAPALVRLYEQMPEPKYVIAMGACTITGGMFSADSTTAVRGVDKLIPVDLYLPGCPPRPEAIFDAVIKLRKKVGNDLITPHPEFGFPGLKDGDSWCVCAGWYARALEAGKGCPIYLKKTHKNTLKLIPIETLKKFAIDLS